MSVVTDIGAITLVAIPYVLASQATGAQDAVKKQQVVSQIDAIIAKPGGIDLPRWLDPYRPQLVSACIEAAVWLAKTLLPDFMSASKPPSPTT